jgi:hypothetical protein
MISSKKVAPALYAVHLILVKVRSLAAEGTNQQKLYRILDWSEVLPSLIGRDGEDATNEFRSTLLGLGEEFPEFAGLLQNFDKGLSWETCPQAHGEG